MLFRQMAKPTLGVIGVFDRLHTLANLQRTERVEHHGQFVRPLLAQRFFNAARMRTVRQAARDATSASRTRCPCGS